MKRIFFLALTAVMLFTAAFSGCSAKRECDFCGEKTKCSKVEYLGEECYVCEDCEKVVDFADNTLDNAMDLLG